MGILYGFSGCTLASTFNSWVLGDDAASDCQRWHPLLLRFVEKWQSSSLGLGRGEVDLVQTPSRCLLVSVCSVSL